MKKFLVKGINKHALDTTVFHVGNKHSLVDWCLQSMKSELK